MNPLRTTFHPNSPDRTKDDLYKAVTTNTAGQQRLPGGTPSFQNGEMAKFLTELRALFQNVFSPQNPGRNVTGGYGPGGAGGGYKGPSGSGTNVNTTPATKLDLKLSSNVNLMVDGRVLAQTLQTYLASELLRTDQTTGSITRRYII